MEDKTFPIYHGNESTPKISFVVNVAWGNEYLIDLLHLLDQRNLHFTFFLQGMWTEQYHDLALMIKDANQEIGSHAYSHRDMTTISDEEIRMEILISNEIINKLLGVMPKYFSPPYGYCDTRVLEKAAQANMRTILWSLDTLDWKIDQPNVIMDRIIPNLRNGSIILMHPTESSLKALPYIIEKALEENYKIVNISGMLNNI